MPSEEDDSRSAGPTLRRRALLAAATSGLVGSLAGCQSDGSGTETKRETTIETDAPTPTATASSTPSPTATATASPTPTPRGTFDTSYLDESPSSEFAPTSGFGTVDWFGEYPPQVIKVTNLKNSGEGSLRWALSQRGTRIVVFEVGGVIDLQGDTIRVFGNNVFVAGHTAPSPGITLIRGGLETTGVNVLIQHVRVRPGDQLGSGAAGGGAEGSATDAMRTTQRSSNVIFDHCSVSWGSDENMSTAGTFYNRNITFSNNIIAEGLSHSPLHPEKEHSKGTLIMDGTQRASVIGNLYAHNTDRHPRIKGGAQCAVVNNYVYDFVEAVEMGGGPPADAVGSIVGNHYKIGAAPVSGPLIKAEGHGARAYVSFNVSSPGGIATNSSRLERLEEKPLWPEGLSFVGPGEVPDHNLSTAGARPADRTPHDERIVSDVRNGTGERIDSQSEVGGYPDLESSERTLDVPPAGDGLAEWLYQHRKAVELPDAEPP